MDTEEKTLFEAVVVFFRRGNDVLLILKKLKIGKGCRNGYGGGIEPGETPKHAAVRETSEESGGVEVREQDLVQIADTYFHNTKSDSSTFTCRVRVFEAYHWVGEFLPTDEAADPRWYPISALPLAEMLLADPFWVPTALSGKKIKVEANYGPFQKELIGSVKITEIDSFIDD
ncbi:MAG: NUDIX domain-containing protein [Candidatus Paceibacterota bacterium]|jgi:8-oxo-dGTP diphosphatase